METTIASRTTAEVETTTHPDSKSHIMATNSKLHNSRSGTDDQGLTGCTEGNPLTVTDKATTDPVSSAAWVWTNKTQTNLIWRVSARVLGEFDRVSVHCAEFAEFCWVGESVHEYGQVTRFLVWLGQTHKYPWVLGESCFTVLEYSLILMLNCNYR